MKIALAHLDLVVIEEVDIRTWRSLFDEIGWPLSLRDNRDELDHTAVLEALQTDEPSADLLLALEALNDLGTETGRDAIHRAVQAAGVGSDALPEDTGEREFAIHLFLGKRHDAALADVFERAQVEVGQRGNVRSYSEFLGRDARSVKEPKVRADRLEEAVRQYCSSRQLGNHVEVRLVHDDTALLLHIVRSHHKRKPLAVLDGQNGRAQIQYRPVHADLLRYVASSGQLRIAARATSLVDYYRQAAGDVLFDDPDFFTNDVVCSLEPLLENGRKALDQNIPGIGRVWMTECAWEHGESVLRLRSPDCFEELEHLELPLQSGKFTEAKLKLQVSGTSTRPVTVTIRVPRKIQIRGKQHEQLVETFLEAAGIRCSAPPRADVGLWSLACGTHSVDAWRAVMGAHTDPLICSHALRQVDQSLIEHPDHPGAGRVLEVERIGAGGVHGASQMEEVPSRRLSETDVVGLRLDPEQLRVYLATRLGIDGHSYRGVQDGVLDLGVWTVDGFNLRLYYALVPPRSGLGQILRRSAAGATPILLLPSPVDTRPEVDFVHLDAAIPERRKTLRQALIAGGLENKVAAIHTAPERAKLVVDVGRGEVWFKGVPVRGFDAESQPFKFVLALALAEPKKVDSKELSNTLSGARKDGNTVVRQAKRKARMCINTALCEANQPEGDDPFPSAGAGFYRCVVGAHVAGEGGTTAS